MTDPEYVLCRWKKRLWPAKVLSKIVTSTRSGKTASFNVEILGVKEQTKITCTDPEPLERERIQIIVSELRDWEEKPADELEEIKYRCALKIALNILNGEASSKQVGLSNEGPITRSAQKKIKALLSLSPDSASCQVPLPKELKGHQTLKKEEQKKQSLQTDPKPPKSKLSLNSEEGAKPCRNNTRSSVSKSKDLSNACKSESQNHKTSQSKVKTLKNQEKVNSELSKAVRSSSLTREENVKTKEGRKRSRKICEPSSPITRLQVPAFLGQSTPVSANYTSATAAAFGTKANGKKRCGRRLLDSSMECLSTELQSEVSEESEASGRKCRILEGSKKLVNSRLVWKRASNAVASPCRKRRCRSCPEPLCKASNPRKRPDHSPWPREEKNKSNLRAKNIELPDFQEDEELEASDLSSKLNSSENSHLVSNLVDEEEDEDEELPSFLLHQEPSSIEPGMLVWCKLPRYPYWPAVVKRVFRKPKKAAVLLIHGNVDFKKPKGFSTHLRNLKHFDCEEKQKLIDQAKEDYSHELEWCIELISDYRIRVGCHSFTGSFLEYLADDISYPVRKEVNQSVVQMTFPHVAEEDLEESVLEIPSDKPSKKVLPDRTRAARDKANEKIVEFIVKTKGAEEHLQAILKSQKQSRWLKEFLNSSHYVTCVETYLEDERQLDLVVNYLKKVYHETDARKLDLVNGDKIKFILDVLLPEFSFRPSFLQFLQWMT
ncbi:PREDICTED: PWWP domain-containing protein MUM1 isoform X2 [Gavialis gangeticus]|uniref:PWWP domain-containing protein MUM1 isoform X2 n=1 Tax=Gavialis gangeticus TaxID=94835 RepID=UPI00092E5B16|nr:PREDICTED: PWWP domain-containing protein MUM1 isoform X2 [Gavialis gangeticus]